MRMYNTAHYRKLYFLLVLLMGVLSLTVWFGIIKPVSLWRQAAGETRDSENERRDLARRIAEKELLETLDSTLRKELDSIGDQLESWHDQQTYLRELHQLTTEKKLTLGNVKVSAKGKLIRLDFQVNGDLRPIMELCYQLETHSMPTRIGEMTLEPAGKRVVARLRLLLWVYDDA